MSTVFSFTRGACSIVAAAAAVLSLGAPAWASDGDVPAARWTGFASLIGGKVLSSDDVGPLYGSGYRCPCYVGDYGNAGVYQGRGFSIKPESHLGVQLNYDVSDSLGLVAQVVSRGSDPAPSLQWAYLVYGFAPEWELVAGRQRIPLFYFSDSQDIGFSLPSVAVPPEYYGWDALNFNALRVRHRLAIGDTQLSVSAFGGREHLSTSNFQKIFNKNSSSADWDQILGADVEWNTGPVQLRAVYLQTKATVQDKVTRATTRSNLRSYGIAGKFELAHYFSFVELVRQDNDYRDLSLQVKAPAALFGVGARYGKLTPFLSYSRYREKPSNASAWPLSLTQRRALTLRYDLDSRSAVKAEYGRFTDGAKNYGGDATVLHLSYDAVF